MSLAIGTHVRHRDDGRYLGRIADVFCGTVSGLTVCDVDGTGYYARELDSAEAPECEGHPAGPFDPMGVTVYCDGSCAA